MNSNPTRALLAWIVCGWAAVAAAAEPAPVRTAQIAEIREEIRRPGASAVLVNLWATWCLPCVDEMPDLLRVARAWRPHGLRVVLISTDFGEDRDARVREFLDRLGVDFPTWIKSGDDAEFIDGIDPRWTGALPATLLFDSAGEVLELWEGQVHFDDVEPRVREIITAATRPTAPGTPSPSQLESPKQTEETRRKEQR